MIFTKILQKMLKLDLMLEIVNQIYQYKKGIIKMSLD